MKNILVTGACGQIGSELVPALRKKYGGESVIATGHVTKPSERLRTSGPFEYLNVSDREALAKILYDYDIDTVYHLAAILSAAGEKNPQLTYDVNLGGLFNVLEAARRYKVKRMMVPSSIAAFGPDTPRDNTPNDVVMRPTTMYGITKVAGELLGGYYLKFGLDVRAVRLPGVISYETLPGGGVTDYAVEIFYFALKRQRYTCYLKEDTILPMIYMPDAIKGLIDLTETDSENLKRRIYNIAAMSFSVKEIVESIRSFLPGLEYECKPDYRQQIADSWPASLDDTYAREEWGWKPEYDLSSMTEDMIGKLRWKLTSPDMSK